MGALGARTALARRPAARTGSGGRGRRTRGTGDHPCPVSLTDPGRPRTRVQARSPRVRRPLRAGAGGRPGRNPPGRRDPCPLGPGGFVVAVCTCRRSRTYPWCDTSHHPRARATRQPDRPWWTVAGDDVGAEHRVPETPSGHGDRFPGPSCARPA
ncbi:CDGSH iron-sulfur domain-containing protein [Streptomyces sp. NBC_01546]|uniref:CDGSH iron-sulfur domain-containing protein n=1 Tax=Streptomyces sp. NBC_01546 TaxID=2975872 RepID=UPI00386769A7